MHLLTCLILMTQTGTIIFLIFTDVKAESQEVKSLAQDLRTST